LSIAFSCARSVKLCSSEATFTAISAISARSACRPAIVAAITSADIATGCSSSDDT